MNRAQFFWKIFFFHSFHIFWDCYCLGKKTPEHGYFSNKTKAVFIALWIKSLTNRTFFMSMKIFSFSHAQNTVFLLLPSESVTRQIFTIPCVLTLVPFRSFNRYRNLETTKKLKTRTWNLDRQTFLSGNHKKNFVLFCFFFFQKLK